MNVDKPRNSKTKNRFEPPLFFLNLKRNRIGKIAHFSKKFKQCIIFPTIKFFHKFFFKQYLITKMILLVKQNLGLFSWILSFYFNSDVKVIPEAISDCLKKQAPTFYCIDFDKLIYRWAKCLRGDHVKK